jgi:uncharacterized membrane protein
MSLMTTLILNSGIIPNEIVNKHSSDLNPESLLAEIYSMPTLVSDSTITPKKKRYQIIFDNKSEYKIDVAIRYKEYSGEWMTDAWVTLNPGEKKLMGSSDQKSYFYYAKTVDKSIRKLKFWKQDIWECYNSEMCNSFAVFR